jgi:hypothetical protein
MIQTPILTMILNPNPNHDPNITAYANWDDISSDEMESSDSDDSDVSVEHYILGELSLSLTFCFVFVSYSIPLNLYLPYLPYLDLFLSLTVTLTIPLCFRVRRCG